MAIREDINLDYLRDRRVQALSCEMFRSSSRLPILGAVLELTPEIDVDQFYSAQIANSLQVSRPWTFRELRRAERNRMISRGSEPSGTGIGDIVIQRRCPSPWWKIIEASLTVVKNELGLATELATGIPDLLTVPTEANAVLCHHMSDNVV